MLRPLCVLVATAALSLVLNSPAQAGDRHHHGGHGWGGGGHGWGGHHRHWQNCDDDHVSFHFGGPVYYPQRVIYAPPPRPVYYVPQPVYYVPQPQPVYSYSQPGFSVRVNSW